MQKLALFSFIKRVCKRFIACQLFCQFCLEAGYQNENCLKLISGKLQVLPRSRKSIWATTQTKPIRWENWPLYASLLRFNVPEYQKHQIFGKARTRKHRQFLFTPMALLSICQIFAKYLFSKLRKCFRSFLRRLTRKMTGRFTSGFKSSSTFCIMSTSETLLYSSFLAMIIIIEIGHLMPPKVTM